MDAVLLDAALPGVDGFNVVRHLRRSGAQLAVVLLTAREELADRIAALEAGGPSAESGTPSVSPEPPAPARILLVENDEVVQSVAREMLEQGGFVVQVASDASTALAVVDQGEEFDVLFVEVLLPDMSGIELARSARRRHHLAGARTLFASGSRITPADLEQHDAFIFKPYGMAALWAAIEALLG